jgi:hypothetical protein
MSFIPGDIPAAEYEFFAENSIVAIIPNLSLAPLELIQVRRDARHRACVHLTLTVHATAQRRGG